MVESSLFLNYNTYRYLALRILQWVKEHFGLEENFLLSARGTSMSIIIICLK